MKIGIDIRNIGKKRTGDEVVFFNLVKNLAESDFSHTFLLFTDILDEKVLEKIKHDLGISNKSNFEIVSLKASNKFIWNSFALPKYLNRNPVNIYLTQYITPFFVGKKIKIITVIHDISFNFFPQFIKKSDLFFLKLLIPFSLKRADKIVGVSKFTRDEILKFYKINPNKVDWIHNAISQNFLQTPSRDKLDSVRKKYNLPEKFLLYLGTLQPRKNIPTLVEAFSKIQPKFPDVKLVLAGNRNAHNFDRSIDKVISENGLEGKIIFSGYIDEDDKPALFKSAEIFCFPSFYEGFGIPILEAMSMEIPVIASEIPAHLEIAGNSVLYFKPHDPSSLAEKISTLLDSEVLKKSLIENGKKRVLKFSWRKTASKFISILNNLSEK